MNHFSPDENKFQESDNEHIIPGGLEVAPARRSKLGIFLLFLVAFLLMGGIVYMSFLIVTKKSNWDGESVVAELSDEKDSSVISLTDFDETNKLRNPVDPFKGQGGEINRVIVEKADFGDAPEETSILGQVDYELFGSFPTVLDESIAGSIRHLETDQSFFLGMRKYGDKVTLESDANTVDLDEGDDGVIFPLLTPCNKHSLQFEVSVPKDLATPYYLNALADWNRDSKWSGSSVCVLGNEPFSVPEWFVQNMELGKFYGVLPGDSRRLIIPNFLVGPKSGKIWFRFTLTNEPIVVHDEVKGWDGSGYFLRGETEDYLVPVFGDEENSIEESAMETPVKTDEKKMEDSILEDLIPGYKDILSEPIFTDVSPDSWYAPFVRFVSKEGVMKGFADNSFKPSQVVTRAELITIALRLRGADIRGEAVDSDNDGLLDLEEMILQTDPKNSDTDGDKLNDYREIMNFTDPLVVGGKITSIPIPLDTIWARHWARGNIAKALLMGLMSNKSFEIKNKFLPDNAATQEFALVVLLRASNKTLPSEDYLESAEKLGLIQSRDSFDLNASINRATVAKFVAKLWNE